MRILDVGCGTDKYPGSVGADWIRLPGVDLVCDLNAAPWPFRDNSFQHIVCRHSLSHMWDLIPVLREIHRVAAPGCVVEVIAPHYASDNFYSDPTHRLAFGYRTMNYFAANLPFHWRYYTELRFNILDRHLSFRGHRLHPGQPRHLNPARWIGFEWLVNAFPRLYERFFAFVLPVSEVYFRLEVVKTRPRERSPGRA